MKRIGSIGMAILALVGGFFILQQIAANGWKIPGLQLPGVALSRTAPPPRGGDTIRIATWSGRASNDSISRSQNDFGIGAACLA